MTRALRQQPRARPNPLVKDPTLTNDSQSEHPVVAWRKALLSDGSLFPKNDLNSTARLVGLGLSMDARWSMKAWPSATRVGGRCGLSERGVRRGFEALEAAGWVEAVERGGVAGGRRTTVWKLLTPEPLSGVTPVPESEVEPVTPEPPSTTPDKSAPTPEPLSDELEELGTELGERAPDPSSLVTRHPEEVAAALQTAATKYGRGRVSDLVAAYLAQSLRFVYASDLLGRIDRDAAAPVRLAPPVRTYCTGCNRTGWTLPLDSDIAVRCECNPDTIPPAKEATA